MLQLGSCVPAASCSPWEKHVAGLHEHSAFPGLPTELVRVRWHILGKKSSERSDLLLGNVVWVESAYEECVCHPHWGAGVTGWPKEQGDLVRAHSAAVLMFVIRPWSLHGGWDVCLPLALSWFRRRVCLGHSPALLFVFIQINTILLYLW